MMNLSDEQFYKIQKPGSSYLAGHKFQPYDLYQMASGEKAGQKARVETAVVDLNNQVQRKECGLKCVFEFKALKKALTSKVEFKCPHNIVVKSYEEIEANQLYQYIQSQVHQATQAVYIIGENVFHSYIRPKKYVAQLFDDQVLQLVPYISHQMKNINQNHQFMNLYDRTNEVFYAVCLQDAVKLIIPVRHVGCKHASCYDLTTLFLIFKENQVSDQKQTMFKCVDVKCQSKFDLESLDNFKSQIVLDHQLLHYINYGFPSSIKFYYDKSQNKLIDEFTHINKDPIIQQYLIKMQQDISQTNKLASYVTNEVQNSGIITITDKILLKTVNGQSVQPKYDFEKIQLDIFLSVQQLFNTEVDSKVIPERKFQRFTLCMQDQITQLPILYPARCKECVKKNIDKYWDLRSLIAYFQIEREYQKAKKNFDYKIVCPICNTQQANQLYKMVPKNFIQLDNSMMSKLLMDQSYTKLQNNIFSYDGRKLMLEMFTYKQYRDTNSIITEQFQQSGQIQFEKLICQITKEKLKEPLLLLKCEFQNHVSFSAFYELYNDATDVILLCKCKSCCTCPIKKSDFFKSIIYDGIMAEALSLVNPNIDINKPIVYDFKQKKILKQELAPNAQTLKPKDYKAKKGFIDLMDDETYQNLFLPQGEDNNITLVEVSQNIGGVEMIMRQDGIHVDTGHFTQYIGQVNEFGIMLVEEPEVKYEGLN